MTVTIDAVPALPHAADIKALFLAHQRPEFPDFFDRAYPSATANGAQSWIGRDAEGQVVMHIACFPRRFAMGPRTALGGLLVNLMVAERLRSFFPALALLQRLIRDVTARGEVDFLYADPNEESRALLRGTRFGPLGTLRRYVLPVRGRGPAADLVMRAWHGLVRLTHGVPRRARVTAHAARDFQAERIGVPKPASRVAAFHDEALYRSRLPGYPGDWDWWLVASPVDGVGPETALLVRGPDPRGRAVLHALRPGADALAATLPGLIAELRRLGCQRLQVSTIAESDLARSLRRCGFIPRRETVPLFALPLTSLGRECVAAVKDWEITDLECDR